MAPMEVVATTLPLLSVPRSAEARPVNHVVPVLVSAVVEAPPFMEKMPLVMVEDAFEINPFVNVARPPEVKPPEIMSEPSEADCAKRLVELAVVEKRFVVVAFPSEALPLEVRLAAVSVVPSKARFALSVKAPAVVMYGTLPEVSEETVRLVVLAVPKYPVPETARAVELAYGSVLATPSPRMVLVAEPPT